MLSEDGDKTRKSNSPLTVTFVTHINERFAVAFFLPSRSYTTKRREAEKSLISAFTLFQTLDEKMDLPP